MDLRFYAVFEPRDTGLRGDLLFDLLGVRLGALAVREAPPFSATLTLALANLQGVIDRAVERSGIRVDTLPTLLSDFASREGSPNGPSRLVAGFVADDPQRVRELRDRLATGIQANGTTYTATLGSDAVIAALDQHWCPAPDQSFGFRSQALERIGWSPVGDLTGEGVNVVVFDTGIDWVRAGLEGTAQKGGRIWPKEPPTWGPHLDPTRHGTMLARLIHRIAPKAVLFSAEALPPPPAPDLSFIQDMHAAVEHVLDIERKKREHQGRRWVFVHAWGMLDSRLDNEEWNGIAYKFADQANHPFHALAREVAAAGIDQVVAAGNCGDFCPDRRCGPEDIGAGRSILGASSHPAMLSVGAVAVDGVWVGLSSIGPGQECLGIDDSEKALAKAKPDLVAPSFFADDEDHGWRSGGSSASCAMAASAVACLRGKGSPYLALSPAQLAEHLRTTAIHAPGQTARDDRRGHGILNLAKASEPPPPRAATT